MKKILYMCVAVATMLVGCKNDDKIFEDSAAQRLNKAEKKYSDLMTSAPHGWAFEYYPTSSVDDGAWLYAMYFYKDGSVVVAGDPELDHTITSERSLWDITTDQGPVLSFSTYNNLIHMWSNPNADGEGMAGDYEFCFVADDNEDASKVIMLRGKKRGLKSRLRMIDEDLTPEEYLKQCDDMQLTHFPTTQKNYSVLRCGDKTYRLDEMNTSVPTYYPIGTDPIFTGKKNSYILAKYDGKFMMRFNKMFYNSDSTLHEKDFIYDDAEMAFVGANNKNIRVTPPEFAYLASVDLLDKTLSTEKLVKTSAMSDSFKALWTAAENALKAKNNTLNESVLSITNATEEGNCTITLKYKPKTGAAATVYYLFNIEYKDGKVALTYVKPYNTGAENVLKNFPACEDYIKGFEGTYTVDNP
ncbi:MAG: DUF4302 domain-containing protein, partial [Bacteroidaceae bacterium]|nr:DUF4302 domain-containing protein [Bacteroidaceae bacterium]